MCPCSNTPQKFWSSPDLTTLTRCVQEGRIFSRGVARETRSRCHLWLCSTSVIQYDAIQVQIVQYSCSDHPPNSHRPQSYRLIEDLRSAACQHYHTIKGQLCQHCQHYQGSTMPTLSHYDHGSTMPTLSHFDHGSVQSLSPHCWTQDHAKDIHKMTEGREPNK